MDFHQPFLFGFASMSRWISNIELDYLFNGFMDVKKRI